MVIVTEDLREKVKGTGWLERRYFSSSYSTFFLTPLKNHKHGSNASYSLKNVLLQRTQDADRAL